ADLVHLPLKRLILGDPCLAENLLVGSRSHLGSLRFGGKDQLVTAGDRRLGAGAGEHCKRDGGEGCGPPSVRARPFGRSGYVRRTLHSPPGGLQAVADSWNVRSPV